MQKSAEGAPRLPRITGMASLLDKIARDRPLVQVVTSHVAADLSANVLLAAGASPIMAWTAEEAGEIAAKADALCINVGALSPPALAGMLAAARQADESGKPWVLDPVGAGGSAYRNAALAQLLAFRPAIIRGNASEIIALARLAGLSDAAGGPKGVDGADLASAAEAPAIALARAQGCVAAATGAVDFITDGTRCAHIRNGSPMMPLVTALGCALSALTAAFAAVSPDRFAAAGAALLAYGVVGESAEDASEGPGSFRMAFLDLLHHLTAEDIVLKGKFEPCRRS